MPIIKHEVMIICTPLTDPFISQGTGGDLYFRWFCLEGAKGKPTCAHGGVPSMHDTLGKFASSLGGLGSISRPLTRVAHT